MKHWSEKYLQIQYKDMNCSKFCEHVLRDHFGIDFNFPQSQGTLFAQSQQIRENMPTYCIKTDYPQDGDMVLMHGKRQMCHVGIYIRIGISGYVLHTESRLRTAALHKLNDLNAYGFYVEGFYKWRK